MNILKIKSFLLSICLFTSILMSAQSKHEIGIHAGGGLSSLKYDSSFGSQKNGQGLSLGIDYSLYFNTNWSIKTGLSVATYNSKIAVNTISDKYPAQESSGEFFELQYTVDNYKEKQNTMLLNIPLMIQFEYGNITKFYVAGGVKVGLPINSKIKINQADIVAKGYFPQINETPLDEPLYMGFGTFRTTEEKKDLDLNISVMLALESGVKWTLSDNMFLYTGAYLDWGMNDIRKIKGSNWLEYNKISPTDYKFNSMLQSQYATTGGTQTILEKVVPIAIGAKVRLSFTL